MGYIIKNDFISLLTLDDLDRLTNTDDRVWQRGEASAIEETASYLRHRYDTVKEFRQITLYNAVNAYNEGDRVYLIENAGLANEEYRYFTAIQDVPTLQPITDTAFWTAGDDRNQKLITGVILIILYELYTRLNGSEIPNWLGLRYDGGDPQARGGIIGYLKQVQKGTVTLDLDLLEDVEDGTTQSGNRIAYGTAETIVDRNTSI